MRTPAAFCGVVGLKTTKGMLSTEGIVPLSHTFDTPGPLARSVDDCAVMCASMLPAAGRDAFMAAYAEANGRGVSSLKLACMGPSARALVHEPAQLAAFDAALGVLRSLGATIDEYNLDVSSFLLNSMSRAEGYFHHRALVDDPSTKMDSGVRVRMKDGAGVTAQEYIACDLARAPALRDWLDGMGERVAWLSPTTARLPIPLADAAADLTETTVRPGTHTHTHTHTHAFRHKMAHRRV